MKASEFVEKLKELIREYNNTNDIIISDIYINPTMYGFEDGTYHTVNYEVKFKNWKP